MNHQIREMMDRVEPLWKRSEVRRTGLSVLFALVVLLSVAVGPVLASSPVASSADSSPTIGTSTPLQTGSSESASDCVETEEDSVKDALDKISGGEGLINGGCLVIQALTGVVSLQAEYLRNIVTEIDFTGRYETSAPDPAGGPANLLTSEPQDPVWALAYENTWFGTGGSWPGMTASALLLLVLVMYARAGAGVFGVTKDYHARRFKKGIYQPAFLIMVWYPIAAIGVTLVQLLGDFLLPNTERVAAMWSLLAAASADVVGFTGLLALPLLFIIYMAGASARFAVEVFFLVQDILLPVFVLVMPLLIVGMYSEIPGIADFCAGIAKRFIPLLFLKFPAILLYWGLVHLTTTPSGSGLDACTGEYCLRGSVIGILAGPIAVAIIYIIMAFATYKLLTMSLPNTVSNIVQTGTSLGAGAGVFAVTGNPRAGMMATRNAGMGAAYGASKSSYRRTEND